MNINIHNIKLDDNSIYVLDCPSCKISFKKDRSTIKLAIYHNQTAIFCSKKCAIDSKRVTSETLINRILEFYNTYNKIPTFKDFKYASIFRRTFGNWSNALKACGLEKPKKLTENKHRNTWLRQQERSIKIKKYYIEELGGKCSSCGYCKNYAALQFHHCDTKTMSLDARSLGNCSQKRIKEEMAKCILLCSNCHLELHNPNLNL